MSAYRYLYYRLYEWYLRKFGEDDAPEFSALGIVFLFSLQNVVTIPIALSASGVDLSAWDVKGVLVVAAAALALGHWALLFRGGRYREILSEFEGESDAQRRRRGLGVLAYLVGTPALLFGLAFGTTPTV